MDVENFVTAQSLGRLGALGSVPLATAEAEWRTAQIQMKPHHRDQATRRSRMILIAPALVVSRKRVCGIEAWVRRTSVSTLWRE